MLQTLVKPNNMTLTQSYEEKRDLLISQHYKRSNTTVASRIYTYDTLGCLKTRSTSKDGASVNDSFGYNSRSELNTAIVNNKAYTYDYDNIGNRESAQEAAESVTTYESNRLNQYTAIGDFEPTYDDAGNQTKVKTSTGIWSVVYNAENRPTSFTNADSSTVVECTYDYKGRRATKKVTVNGRVTLHQRFLYRGYLQIACCDLTRNNHPCLWLITWDPSQPVATRPLAIQKDGTWYTYGWDLTKNICEIYGQHGYIRTNYSYAPYGEVFISGDVTQTIQWSSEQHDVELGLIYYNYRHYCPWDAKWLSRDRIKEAGGLHLSSYSSKTPLHSFDYLGLNELIISGGCNTNPYGVDKSTIYFDSYLTYLFWSAVQEWGGSCFHDQNWANFILAAEEEIKNRKQTLALGEEIEWAVELSTYRVRAINDRKDSDYYLNIIRQKAKELGVKLRFYTSKQSLADIINSVELLEWNFGTGEVTPILMARAGQDRISRFVYFGHGTPGRISPRHDFYRHGIPKQGYAITTHDIQNGIFLKSSFMESAISISYACNSATRLKTGGDSFTTVWRGYFGSLMYGVNGRLKYNTPTQVVPSEKPNDYGETPTWIPAPPNHN